MADFTQAQGRDMAGKLLALLGPAPGEGPAGWTEPHIEIQDYDWAFFVGTKEPLTQERRVVAVMWSEDRHGQVCNGRYAVRPRIMLDDELMGAAAWLKFEDGAKRPSASVAIPGRLGSPAKAGGTTTERD